MAVNAGAREGFDGPYIAALAEAVRVPRFAVEEARQRARLSVFPAAWQTRPP